MLLILGDWSVNIRCRSVFTAVGQGERSTSDKGKGKGKGSSEGSNPAGSLCVAGHYYLVCTIRQHQTAFTRG